MILSDKLSFFIDTLRHLLPHRCHRQRDNGCVLKEILLINLIIIISLSATTSRECVDRISIKTCITFTVRTSSSWHNHIFAPKMIKVDSSDSDIGLLSVKSESSFTIDYHWNWKILSIEHYCYTLLNCKIWCGTFSTFLPSSNSLLTLLTLNETWQFRFDGRDNSVNWTVKKKNEISFVLCHCCCCWCETLVIS